MNNPIHTATSRLAAATLAAVTTVALFSAVVDIAEPQRGAMFAAAAARQAVPGGGAASAPLAVAGVAADHAEAPPAR